MRTRPRFWTPTADEIALARTVERAGEAPIYGFPHHAEKAREWRSCPHPECVVAEVVES